MSNPEKKPQNKNMNWKHYLGICFGFITTDFVVNFLLDYLGLTAWIYQPATALGLKKTS